ncbi:MAG: hypothetical protein WCL16_01380 [bacterium]
MTGLAATSFFPAAVQAAADGNPLYFILGAVCGLLPDTLDFRFARFFHRHTLEVILDPNQPDPAMIADAVAQAVALAVARTAPVTLKLNTARLGANAWQAYTVFFDRPQSRVVATCTGPVTTGSAPLPDSAVPAAARHATSTRKLAAGIVTDGDPEVKVDIFDGPTLRFYKRASGELGMEFLPWHRAWSHSLALAAMTGGVLVAIWSWTAGLVACAAWSAHVLADQLGHMGANLGYPFTRHRINGARLHHAGDGWPNLITVWASGLLILWNLARLTPASPPSPALLPLLVWGGVVPLFAAWSVDRLLARRG